MGDGDGVMECGAGGHESGGGEYAGVMELFDGAVDAGSQAEVVGVDDELRGHGDKDTWPVARGVPWVGCGSVVAINGRRGRGGVSPCA